MMVEQKCPTIVLLGAGGHARVCIDVIEQHGGYEILGLVDLPSEVGKTLLGYPILGSDDDLPAILAKVDFGVVTIGQIKNAEPRQRLYAQLCAYGTAAPAIVSPKAFVSPHASIGMGTMVVHGAVVNAGATVGENCIVNTLSLVEHDVSVGNNCHVSTGCRINSGVLVGDGTFVGSGSVVRQGLSIGKNCVIGMATAVLKDCPDGTVSPHKAKKENL
ncbi:acetyltransferase [Cohaesibacter gelatinilyticus]|uniref:Sugar O-acyltransferase, sialic acid O-acetyltransferase NeuD family n=1 Tax=Cohaesibacter gelatinilyticus TaxID=372072 RepID=A0A285PFQ8_9HYPH|nr:acetyltransferase [Cohaesibacter gelatinilyticus]SNZ20123.1 sugar O-acyltransferase, sialic acid O-acetyltransferase NeuD family [Cohaesibacter gelatinilyticus]